ncbi:GILT-like protein C02D5.2 [Trichinella pseudospiralis]|uniref:GILT-like protein C02D5.2 n=1 Tax=Trichinella pseudospiralis TaxID=6337 RepID=A0A0V1G2E1_TRIPS|nr:GILT-like protein C02D5.2 [Trichinella pseudospiralis]
MPKKKLRFIFLLSTMGLGLLLIFAILIALQLVPNPNSGHRDKVHSVQLRVFYESQCPDSTSFLRTQLEPLWPDLLNFVNVSLVPFGKASWKQVDDDDFVFRCQHGMLECALNQAMSCAEELIRPKRLLLPLITCLQQSFHIDKLHQCANAYAPADVVDELIQCSSNSYGRRLLYQMGLQTKNQKPPIYYVPWIEINGQRNTDAEHNLKQELCKTFNHSTCPLN